MTARERAEALVPEEWAGSTEERIRQIESAIHAAEAAVCERLAVECDRLDARDPNEWFSPNAIAAWIRMRKEAP
jgi:hypothetical protein